MSTWIPSWLGSPYSRLREAFEDDSFSVGQAAEVLGRRPGTRMVLSGLVKAGWALRTARGRYMLLDPSLAVATLGVGDWRHGIAQKAYTPLVACFASSALQHLQGALITLAIYGSLARGTAGPTSDIDIMLVVREMPKSYGQRAPILSEIIEKTTKIRMELWNSEGIYPDLDVIALTPEEASISQPIYLEMLDDSVFVIDRGGFLAGLLERLRRRLDQLGSKKVTTPGGSSYWLLKPGAEPVEAVEL